VKGRGEVGDGLGHTPVCDRCGHERFLHKIVSPLGVHPISYRCFYQYENKAHVEFYYCRCQGPYTAITRSELMLRRETGWWPEERRWLDDR
jgi:hypothetical protein